MYIQGKILAGLVRSGGNKNAQLCRLFNLLNAIMLPNAKSISKLSPLHLHHKAANGKDDVRSSEDETRAGNSQEGGRHKEMVYFTTWVPPNQIHPS